MGFPQQDWVDENDVFSLVVKHTSIRVMLIFVLKFDLELDQMYIRTTFLHGNLQDLIYMELL